MHDGTEKDGKPRKVRKKFCINEVVDRLKS